MDDIRKALYLGQNNKLDRKAYKTAIKIEK
jgi:hypothetical protein